MKTDEIDVKPYFTERMIATTESIHLVVCVHGLDGKYARMSINQSEYFSVLSIVLDQWSQVYLLRTLKL